MIEHALNDNNDIFIRNGSFATVSKGEQVLQHVRTRLQFYLKEWFLDTRSGTPWLQEIFVKPFNPASIESILKARIANTPELSSIIEFSMSVPDISSRKLQITFSAETVFGTLTGEEIFING